jgi:hypothetical protein
VFPARELFERVRCTVLGLRLSIYSLPKNTPRKLEVFNELRLIARVDLGLRKKNAPKWSFEQLQETKKEIRS